MAAVKCQDADCNTDTKGRRFCTECGLEQARPKLKSGTATKVLFDRTLYPACLVSCVTCRPVHIVISDKRIDKDSGCCYGNSDTLDIRRIKDIKYQASCFQMLFGRGTITIYAADETDETTIIRCFGAKQAFVDIRDMWNQSKQSTLVD